jgi:hypothetical protein
MSLDIVKEIYRLINLRNKLNQANDTPEQVPAL